MTDASGGSFDLNLPTSDGSNMGQQLVVANIGASGQVNVEVIGGVQLIDGGTPLTLTPGTRAWLTSTGTGWITLARLAP